MKSRVIWIDYHPRLYQDLLLRVIQHLGQQDTKSNINIITGNYLDTNANLRGIDAALLSLDKVSHHNPSTHVSFSVSSKLIAFSPSGICGWIFEHRIGKWELIYPFEISRLLFEVFGSSIYI